MSAANKPVMLELDKVSLNFSTSKGTFDDGVHHVLDDVSFKLHENETLGIIGRNGAGKTTMLAAMLQGSSKKQACSYLEEIKEFADLGDSFEEPVKTYSSGMRSRPGFTTALMTHVDILLIDEVLSVGDAGFKKKAMSAMKGRIGGDQTVVFVSHADSQIEEQCDRAIWIDKARVASEGETGKVLQEYRNSITPKVAK